MNFPDDLYYSNEHTWLKITGNQGLVGITDFAQEEMGDIVYLELPEEGTEIKKDKTFGVIESTKTVSELYSPVSGEIIEYNSTLLDNPELINEDPYGEGWMIRIELSNPDEVDELMQPDEYEEFIEEMEEDEEDFLDIENDDY